MALIPHVNEDALFRTHSPAIEPFRSRLALNITRMWANAPEVFMAGMPLVDALLHKTKLDPACRELLILAVARLEGGVYQWVQHIPVARKVGCSEAQIAALEAAEFEAPMFDQRQQAMLRLALDVVRNVRACENYVTEAASWFDAQELVEIVITSGFYMIMARMTESLRVEVDAPPGVDTPVFGRLV